MPLFRATYSRLFTGTVQLEQLGVKWLAQGHSCRKRWIKSATLWSLGSQASVLPTWLQPPLYIHSVLRKVRTPAILQVCCHLNLNVSCAYVSRVNLSDPAHDCSGARFHIGGQIFQSRKYSETLHELSFHFVASSMLHLISIGIFLRLPWAEELSGSPSDPSIFYNDEHLLLPAPPHFSIIHEPPGLTPHYSSLTCLPKPHSECVCCVCSQWTQPLSVCLFRTLNVSFDLECVIFLARVVVMPEHLLKLLLSTWL